MNSLHEECLRQKYRFLLTNLDPTVLLGHMYEGKIFTRDDLANIRGKPTQGDQAYVFLHTLHRGGPRAFGVFMDALRETVTYEYIFDELNSTLQQLSSGTGKVLSYGNHARLVSLVKPYIRSQLFRSLLCTQSALNSCNFRHINRNLLLQCTEYRYDALTLHRKSECQKRATKLDQY